MALIMKINKKQKYTIYAGLFIIIVVFVIWLINGSYVFTQTQVLISKKDPLFGTTYQVWKNKFIWGLDLTLVITALSVILSTVLIFVFRNKAKELNEENN